MNATTTQISKLNIPCNVIFPFTLHSIWLHRTKAVYQNEIKQPPELVCCALRKAVEFWWNKISSSSLATSPKQPPLNPSWSFPPLSWYKLNVDKSMINYLLNAGGCIKDDTSNWICSFSKLGGFGNALQGELWAIMTGLNIVVEKYCNGKFIVESVTLPLLFII